MASVRLIAAGIASVAFAACGAPEQTTHVQASGQSTHHSIDEVPVARDQAAGETSDQGRADEQESAALDAPAARILMPATLDAAAHFIGGARFAAVEVLTGVDVRACAQKIANEAKVRGRIDTATSLTVGAADADGRTIKLEAASQCSLAFLDAANKALSSTLRPAWAVSYFVLGDASAPQTPK
jgi:hypothetical protein